MQISFPSSFPLLPSFQAVSRTSMTLNPNEFVQRHLETQPHEFKVTYTPDELHELCRRSIEILKNEPPIARLRRPVIVVGDLGGHYRDLWYIFERFAENGVNGAYVHDYMFLGNYVSYHKGKSLETICLLLGLKVLNPQNYKLLRGSNECAAKWGFYKELVEKYGDEQGEKLFEHFTEVFAWLPFVGLIENICFCVSRGISPHLKNWEDIEKIPRPIHDPISNPLANDFINATLDPKVRGFTPNPDDKFFFFGEDNVGKFLLDHELLGIVSGSRMIPEGHKFTCEGRWLNVFSAANYRNNINRGAVLKVTPNGTISINYFANVTGRRQNL